MSRIVLVEDEEHLAAGIRGAVPRVAAGTSLADALDRKVGAEPTGIALRIAPAPVCTPQVKPAR